MSSGEYMLHFEDRGDYLYVNIAGQDSFASSLRYWNEIADEVERLDRHKLLVHENMTGDVSGREVYDVMRDLKDSALKGVKIAFYDENSADTFLNRLGKLFANYRGGNVRIFSELDAARQWIESNP